MTQDVNVSLLDFKDLKGNEMVVQNEDGSFTILINSRLSHSGQIAAYNHALRHIENGDFDKKSADVQEIEAVAHDVADQQREKTTRSDDFIKKKIAQIQRRRRKLQRQMEQDAERVEFLSKNFNVFDIEAYRFRYGEPKNYK